MSTAHWSTEQLEARIAFLQEENDGLKTDNARLRKILNNVGDQVLEHHQMGIRKHEMLRPGERLKRPAAGWPAQCPSCFAMKPDVKDDERGSHNWKEHFIIKGKETACGKGLL